MIFLREKSFINSKSKNEKDMRDTQKLILTLVLVCALIIAVPSASMAQTEQMAQIQPESTIPENSNRNLMGCVKAVHVQTAGGVIRVFPLFYALGQGLEISGTYGVVRDCR